MPDVKGRDELERKLSRLMGKLLNAYGGRLLESLGDPPSLDNIPAEFWDEEGRVMSAALRPMLEQIFLDQAKELMDEAPSGVDWSQANEAAIEWARGYAFDLVRGINQTTVQHLQRVVSGYFQEPTTIGDLERQIMNTIASPVRAEMIAVTEVTRAASEGEQQIARELRDQGINMIPVWQTNADELVCELCGPKHNQPITDGQYPPEHPRCVLPGNIVAAPGGVTAAAKSFYVGGCVEIIIADGRSLTVTQNHPILTPRGWVAADKLREGDDILGCADVQRVLETINPHDNHRPAEIEQIFDALMKSGKVLSVSVPAAPEDFHGDGRGINGNVQVVHAHRFLLSNIKTGITEPASQGVFGVGTVTAGALPTNSVSNHLGFTNDTPAGGLMGGGDLGGALGGAHAFPLDAFGLGLVAGSDTRQEQITPEGGAINTRLAGEFILAFPGLITLDKIGKIRHFDFSGHVYDLQCDKFELYTCNGIITHNCRCWVNHELRRTDG